MNEDEALNTARAAELLGIAEKTLANARSGGLIGGRPGPQYRKLGTRCVYSTAELKRWRDQFELRNPQADF